MDEITGQFYAVFGNSYQRMCTIPRLLYTWEPGQLIDELAATRCAFGCMGPRGPAPATQISQPCLACPVNTAYNEDIIPDPMFPQSTLEDSDRNQGKSKLAFQAAQLQLAPTQGCQ